MKSRWWFPVLWLCLAAPALAASQRELAQTKALLAVEYMRIGNMRVALQSADEAIQADSSFSGAYLARALVLMQLKVDRDADAAFQKALALDPANPEASNNYGWFLCERGRVEDSINYFDRALANPLYDQPQTAEYNKAVCLARMGRPVEANDLLLQVLQASPKHRGALKEMARLHLAQANGKLAAFYYQRYNQLLMPQERTVDDLWLGLQLARLQKDVAEERRLGQELQTRFPDSKETQLLLSGK